MKKSQYLIFFLCLLLLCAGAWFLLNPGMSQQDVLSIRFKDENKIKLGEKFKPVDLIKSTNSTNILYPTIDTSTTGKKSLLYIAIGKHGERKEFLKNIQVIDPTPPVLQLTKNSEEITIGDSFEPNSIIKEAKSNYDGTLDVKITGKYDLNKAGTYQLKYEVKDSSDHTVSKMFTLVVKEKPAPATKPKQELPAQNSPPEKQPEKEQEKPAPQQPSPSISGGTWMFADGYSFTSALSACSKAGANSGRRYQCNVLQDDKGIYIGYQLDLQ